MKILFIVPDSFLRTLEKTDPFYDPIMRVIDEMPGSSWRVLLPRKGIACGYPQEKIGDYKLFEQCGIWFYRIWRLFNRQTPVWKIYRCFGKVAKLFFSRLFDADVIITQTGQFADELSGMFPNKRIVDVQHGIIHSTHDGYFTPDARLKEEYQTALNREFWVYGKGYADCFFKHPENAKDLEGRVKIIGDVLGCLRSQMLSQQQGEVKRDAIVFSLQFTNTTPIEEQNALKYFYSELLTQIAQAKLYECYRVVLKHHPRYGGFDLSEWSKLFPWIEWSNEQTPSLIAQAVFHVTAYSTTAFEYAAEGVPTLFVWNEALREGYSLFIEEYLYPGKGAFDEMHRALINEISYQALSNNAREWYHRFYTSFSKGKCVKLLGDNE